MTAETIHEAIAAMDRRLERAAETDDPRGYFTCVYRAVTARVRDGIAAGDFDDPGRMERFDVTFANLYLDAAAAHDRGRACSASWRTAFDAAGRPLLVLQHVLLGMNAHINLDLGVAAAATVPAARIGELEHDFERINDVLVAMVDTMQDALAEASPWTRTLDRLGGRVDEAVTAHGLRLARARAWDFAQVLADAEDRARVVAERDARVAAYAEAIVRPRATTRALLAAARRRERADVAGVAAALRRRGADVPT